MYKEKVVLTHKGVLLGQNKDKLASSAGKCMHLETAMSVGKGTERQKEGEGWGMKKGIGMCYAHEPNPHKTASITYCNRGLIEKDFIYLIDIKLSQKYRW